MRRIDADALKNDLTRFYDGVVTAKQLIDEQPTVGGWISVKDKLPKDEYECLVIAKDHWCYIGWYKGDIQKWVVDGVVWCDETITHWIKIPEPPKEEDDAGQ